MEHEIFQILQALLECIESYPDGYNNKIWFTRLIQNSLNGEACFETELDLIYNATMMDHILATILAIDIKTIVKTKMLHKVIFTMWENKKLDFNILNRYILEEKPIIVENTPTSTESTNYELQSNQSQTMTPQLLLTQQNINQQPEETVIEEITMLEENNNE